MYIKKISQILAFSIIGLTLDFSSAYAASLSYTPTGTQYRDSNDSSKNTISFAIVFNPQKTTVNFQSIDFDYDDEEISYNPNKSTGLQPGEVFNNTTTVANLVFDVLQGVVKDGNSDLFNVQVSYIDSLGVAGTPVASTSAVDVAPVPEPFTILGATAAIGFGGFFKKKFQSNCREKMIK